MSISLNEDGKTLTITLPLTAPSGKIRIKKRRCFNEYGVPVAARREPFTPFCYVERQIGYDAPLDDPSKMALTTVKNEIFVGANGKRKTLYELSEYIYYFYRWGVIGRKVLPAVENFLQKLTEADFLDHPAVLAIERSHPVHKNILGLDFAYTQVKYPLLVYKFKRYEVLAEIKITEKQRAVGVQPMLYFCFPITELKSDAPLLGRPARQNETADFVAGEDNLDIFINMLKIFGMLSANHNHDARAILAAIMKQRPE